jgi:hypothetical protein
MQRRGYLGAVAAGSITIAGCSSLPSLTNDLPDDGPDGAVVSFIQALNEGNVDEADEYLHDAHGSIADVWPQSTLDRFEELDLTIEEVEVVEENDDEATVDLTYSVEGNPNERTEQFGLGRNDDDEWVIVTSEDG